MPFSFGAAGGSCVTTPAGVLVKCDTGDGRQATNQVGPLNLCDLCSKNLAYLQNRNTLGGTDVNSLKATLTTNSKTNLRGT